MRKILLISTLMMTFSQAWAAGILVNDPMLNAKMILEATEQALRFKKDLNESQKRLREIQAQGDHYRNMVDGHYDFEDILNDPTLNEFIALDDWSQIYDNVEELAELREKFGMKSDDPILQRRYDNELKMYRMQQRFYDNSVKRSNKLTELLKQFDSASTPAKKADLANAISYEQTLIQNDAKMYDTITTVMEKQTTLEADAHMREVYRKLTNEGIPRRIVPAD